MEEEEEVGDREHWEQWGGQTEKREQWGPGREGKFLHSSIVLWPSHETTMQYLLNG